MATRCPLCHTRNLRRVHRQRMLEHLLSHCGIYPYRCGVCSHRFFKVINWGVGFSKPIKGRHQKHFFLHSRRSELTTVVPRGRSLTASDGLGVGRTGSAVHVVVILSFVLSMVIVSLLIAAWPNQALFMR